MKNYLVEGKFEPRKLRTYYSLLEVAPSRIDGRLLRVFPEDK